MLIEVAGDILLSSAQAIAHAVAPNDPFHSGLALALRSKWPAMYKDFRHYGQVNHPKPGEIWAWAGVGEHGPVQIASLFAQSGGYQHGDKPGPAELPFLNHALKALHAWVESEEIQSLAIPRLCTGVGRLSWGDAHVLINRHLAALKIPVYLYRTYQPGVAAEELEIQQHSRR